MKVLEAWSAVMTDLRSLGKDGTAPANIGGYKFRGIDAVMDAVGPLFRVHGIVVIPSAIEITTEKYNAKSGGVMKNSTVLMRYVVHGPEGDTFEGAMYGEAADSGDKSTTKAESVAFRAWLLQALAVPTGDPEPDMENHQRDRPSEAEQSQEPASEAKKARQELFAVLTKKKIDPQRAAFKFAEAGHGPLGESTDAAAIRAMTEWFKKEPS